MHNKLIGKCQNCQDHWLELSASGFCQKCEAAYIERCKAIAAIEHYNRGKNEKQSDS